MGRNDDNGNIMNKVLISLAVLATVTTSPAYAISASYRAQLERSGCTQESELRGCDVTKTKAQNSARGFKLETATQKQPDAMRLLLVVTGYLCQTVNALISWLLKRWSGLVKWP